MLPIGNSLDLSVVFREKPVMRIGECSLIGGELLGPSPYSLSALAGINPLPKAAIVHFVDWKSTRRPPPRIALRGLITPGQRGRTRNKSNASLTAQNFFSVDNVGRSDS